MQTRGATQACCSCLCWMFAHPLWRPCCQSFADLGPAECAGCTRVPIRALSTHSVQTLPVSVSAVQLQANRGRAGQRQASLRLLVGQTAQIWLEPCMLECGFGQHMQRQAPRPLMDVTTHLSCRRNMPFEPEGCVRMVSPRKLPVLTPPSSGPCGVAVFQLGWPHSASSVSVVTCLKQSVPCSCVLCRQQRPTAGPWTWSCTQAFPCQPS